jgi:2-dehydro-3-deoxyphosphogluconate aldolase / (4S)-4-hydroxy-2-oxoglutarate aldolase
VTDTAMDIHAILRRAPVIPVLTVAAIEHAVPLARALVRGGLPVLEITLRTPCALAALAAMRDAAPDAIVGVGTLTRPSDLADAERAGAQFGVSPGYAPDLVAAARDVGYPLLPGVMTPSELMAARLAGFTALKLFPAQQAGGAGMVKALGAPFPDVTFCPTGGVTRANAPDYLALPNVACVGGSWVAPADRIAAGDWSAIEALARDAAALRQ